MSYAKKNLREVEDSAVKHGISASQEARFPRGELGAEQTGLNYLIVKPNQREAFAHLHRQAEEIYVVLGGSGRVKLDEELVELQPMDAVRVSPGVARSFEAGGDGLRCWCSVRTWRARASWSKSSGARSQAPHRPRCPCDIDDMGTAAALAGKPRGWLETAERTVRVSGWNVNREGVVLVPAVVGRDIEALVRGTADASLAVFEALLELQEQHHPSS